MQENIITIDVQLNENDLVQFQRSHYSKNNNRVWIAYSIILLVVLIFIYAPNIIQNGISSIPLSIFVPMILGGGLILLSRLYMKCAMKKSFKTDPFLNQPYQVTATEKGIEINSYRSTINPLWEDIYRFKISENAFLIYLSNRKSIIIPKRCFTNDEELKMLTTLCENKIGTNKNNDGVKKIKYFRMCITVIIVVAYMIFTYFNNHNNSNKLETALLYEKLDKYEQAKEIYSKLINDDKENDLNYIYRANCEMKLENYKIAIVDCEKAIFLNSKNGLTYYIYAHALYNQGKYEEACRAINRSIETGYIKDDQGLCNKPEDIEEE